MTAIPIRRNLATRKGHYRCRFVSAPNFTLLVPVQFQKHLTFATLATWTDEGKWKELIYGPAPRRPAPVGRVRL